MPLDGLLHVPAADGIDGSDGTVARGESHVAAAAAAGPAAEQYVNPCKRHGAVLSGVVSVCEVGNGRPKPAHEDARCLRWVRSDGW